MLIKLILYNLFCVIAGGAISAGYVAFITLLGVFEKLSEKYKANKSLGFLEKSIILGVTFGNILHIFQTNISVGLTGVFIYTLFGGIFIGCLSGALAETLNLFPIISRKFKIRDFLPYVIIFAAFGKTVGSLIQLFLL